MARLYSKQFGLWHDSTFGTVGGPEPGTIWVVRQITVYSGNSSSVGVYWNLVEQTVPCVLQNYNWTSEVLASPTGIFFFDGRIVIEPPQYLAWSSGSDAGASGVDVYIGGYVLEGP